MAPEQRAGDEVAEVGGAQGTIQDAAGDPEDRLLCCRGRLIRAAPRTHRPAGISRTRHMNYVWGAPIYSRSAAAAAHV